MELKLGNTEDDYWTWVDNTGSFYHPLLSINSIVAVVVIINNAMCREQINSS